MKVFEIDACSGLPFGPYDDVCILLTKQTLLGRFQHLQGEIIKDENMPFTGDLEHLNLIDIIQLFHTTRKSGIFSVKGGKGESTIVFSNGNIVDANHFDSRISIGSVLLEMNAVTRDDLYRAYAEAKDGGKNSKPLIAALIQTGKLRRDDAQRGLKKLAEMTIVELMSWTKGTFTFDTDSVAASSLRGASGDAEQDTGVDAQMVLMDALRIFDEREREREAGKEVPPFETLYADVLPAEIVGEIKEEPSTITADDLGLADIERLERKIPRPVSEMELFDPVKIHREQIQDLLGGFSSAEQETFVSYLKKSVARKAAPDVRVMQPGKAVVIFSGDQLIRHSVMTICKEDGVPVFAADNEKDLERTVAQCLSALRVPAVVFDSPVRSNDAFTEKKVLSARTAVIRKYPGAPVIQFASVDDVDFFLQSYGDGAGAVFPKPLKEDGKETYIHDTMQFLDTFKSFIKGFQERVDAVNRSVKELKDNIRMLREVSTPSDAAMVMLAGMAEIFERAVTFFVRPSELMGERSVGVNTDKSVGPIRADRLKVSLLKPSVFRDVLEKGLAYYGGSSDEALENFFMEIGRPLSPAVVLLPVICDRRVIAVVYGDFGRKEAAPVQLDTLEILAQQVGIALEYALFRRQAEKADQRS